MPTTPKANCVLAGDSDELKGAGSVDSGSESSLETVPAKSTSASSQVSTRRAVCRTALKDSSARCHRKCIELGSPSQQESPFPTKPRK